MLFRLPPLRGFLSSLEVVPPILVQFQFNPAELDDKRSVTYANVTAPGQLTPLKQYTQGGERTISFTVRVDGTYDNIFPILRDPDGGITPELNKYRAFLYPQSPKWPLARGSFMRLYDDEQQFLSPPTCLFGFGERIIPCIVAEVGIKELLFNYRLAPMRADVSVKLVELSPHDTLDGNLPRGF